MQQSANSWTLSHWWIPGVLLGQGSTKMRWDIVIWGNCILISALFFNPAWLPCSVASKQMCVVSLPRQSQHVLRVSGLILQIRFGTFNKQRAWSNMLIPKGPSLSFREWSKSQKSHLLFSSHLHTAQKDMEKKSSYCLMLAEAGLEPATSSKPVASLITPKMSSGLPRTSGTATSWLGYKFCMLWSRSTIALFGLKGFWLSIKSLLEYIRLLQLRSKSDKWGDDRGCGKCLYSHPRCTTGRGTRVFPVLFICTQLIGNIFT